MKKSMLLLAAASIHILGCTPSKVPELLNVETTRKEIISSISNDVEASAEMIDSLLINNLEQMMMKMHTMMTGNTMMREDMMGKMMDMCKTDSSMCKMMMGKTMAMCDMDKSKCSMMMAAMQEHPKAMKTMQDMGMCDMKGMKMDNKK